MGIPVRRMAVEGGSQLTTFLVFLAIVLFVIIATALWGTIVDGTIHCPPSEWLASVLGILVGLLGASGMLLDEVGK
jgi:hypothetical protein